MTSLQKYRLLFFRKEDCIHDKSFRLLLCQSYCFALPFHPPHNGSQENRKESCFRERKKPRRGKLCAGLANFSSAAAAAAKQIKTRKKEKERRIETRLLTCKQASKDSFLLNAITDSVDIHIFVLFIRVVSACCRKKDFVLINSTHPSTYISSDSRHNQSLGRSVGLETNRLGRRLDSSAPLLFRRPSFSVLGILQQLRLGKKISLCSLVSQKPPGAPFDE